MALTTAELQILITAKDLASRELDQIAGKADDVGKRLTQASVVATAAMAVIAGAAIKTAADFEHSLSQVGAVAGATTAEMGKIRDEALAIGRDTAFGASDAAKAMGELAAGGRTVTQILNGEARAAVDLAAAGNYGLAESGRAIATAMDLWKNETIETTDVVNRMAGAANESRFGVEDMAQAMASGGAVAALNRVSFADFATTITATASAFSSGSDAGTSFKTFLTSLSGNSDQAKETIKALGLEFYDTAGNLKSMSGIVEELNSKLSDLSAQERNEALKKVFGTDAMRTALSLMQMTGAEFEALSRTLGETDAAAIAGQRMDNLKGDIEALKGSLETVAITLGSQALPMLSNLASGATTVVNAFGGLPESTQQLAIGFTAIALAAPAAVSGVSKVADFVKDLKAGSAGLGGTMTAVAVGVGAVTLAVDALLVKVSGSGIMEHLFGDPGLINASKEAVRELSGAMSVAVGHTEQMATAQLRLDAANIAVARGQAEVKGAFEATKDFITGAPSDWDNIEASVRAAGESMVAHGATTRELITAYQGLNPELQKTFDSATNVTSMMAALGEKTAAALSNTTGFAEVYGGVAASITAVAAALPTARDNYLSWVTALPEGTSVLEGLSDAIADLEAKLLTLDPAFVANAVQIAVNESELARLASTGETYSTVLGATKAEIEANTEALKSNNGAAAENAGALAGILEALTPLIGPQGVKALTDDLTENAASVGASQQAVAALATALSTNLPAAAETATGALTGSLGVALSTLEAQGYQGGAQLVAGLLRGIQANQGSAIVAAGGMATSVADIVRRELQMQSPSLVFHRIGVDLVKGFVEGIEAETPAANAAVATMAANAVSIGGAAVLPGPIGGRGGLPQPLISGAHGEGQMGGAKWVMQNGQWVLVSVTDANGYYGQSPDWFGGLPDSNETRGHHWIDANGAFHFGNDPRAANDPSRGNGWDVFNVWRNAPPGFAGGQWGPWVSPGGGQPGWAYDQSHPNYGIGPYGGLPFPSPGMQQPSFTQVIVQSPITDLHSLSEIEPSLNKERSFRESGSFDPWGSA